MHADSHVGRIGCVAVRPLGLAKGVLLPPEAGQVLCRVRALAKRSDDVLLRSRAFVRIVEAIANVLARGKPLAGGCPRGRLRLAAWIRFLFPGESARFFGRT